MQKNSLVIRVCAKTIQTKKWDKFHFLIFDPELNPLHSGIKIAEDLVMLFNDKEERLYLEVTIETPLSSEELFFAIKETLSTPSLKLQIGYTIGRPNMLAEGYAKVAKGDITPQDLLDLIAVNEKELQIPATNVSAQSDMPLYAILQHENGIPDFYQKGRFAG